VGVWEECAKLGAMAGAKLGKAGEERVAEEERERECERPERLGWAGQPASGGANDGNPLCCAVRWTPNGSLRFKFEHKDIYIHTYTHSSLYSMILRRSIYSTCVSASLPCCGKVAIMCFVLFCVNAPLTHTGDAVLCQFFTSYVHGSCFAINCLILLLKGDHWDSPCRLS
jgi:hypothetical protein